MQRIGARRRPVVTSLKGEGFRLLLGRLAPAERIPRAAHRRPAPAGGHVAKRGRIPAAVGQLGSGRADRPRSALAPGAGRWSQNRSSSVKIEGVALKSTLYNRAGAFFLRERMLSYQFFRFEALTGA